MEIRITKGLKTDTVHILRDDGSTATTSFAHKGPVPHDAVHFFVEHELGLKDGFWGKVAAGSHPEALGAMAIAGGHASAKRCERPAQSIVEMVQAERLVECFEADLWIEGGSADAVIVMAASGCEMSLVPALALDTSKVEAVRRKLRRFANEWVAAKVGHEAVLRWH